ncbi:MAG: BrxA/BrxB family bacilliredoxin [Flavobacteriia bacterium]|jgi:putative YphP/YqiW family bacilliredoxin|nr:BrxA/BrxB family bacilliredoxin [Flavobacteriia bacterium]NCU77461.1 BrxA/BrxB family bacilliredoxin [Synechococcaceae bacterium WB7_1C_051]
MYPLEIVQPMKNDLTSVGFEELLSATAVDEALVSSPETMLLVVNSVCGCAAGNMRPGVKMSLNHSKVPSKLYTVFAGFDTDAVQQARKYFLPYPPSSPSIALFHQGALVHFIERHHIEGVSASLIAENLQAAYDEYCS